MTNGIFSAFRVSASGLRAQRIRLDVAAENLANMETTRTSAGEPYRPKRAVFQLADSGRNSYGPARRGGPSFRDLLSRESGQMPLGGAPAGDPNAPRIVDVRIEDVQTPFVERLDPDHPDADENGILRMPNVDPITEMMTLIKATRAYEANATALDAAKDMLSRSLDI